MPEIKEKIEERYIMIVNDEQLQGLQDSGWVMPINIVNHVKGDIVKITRNIKEEKTEKEEQTEEMYIIIENDYQLRSLQCYGWKMPENIINLGVGNFVKITREKIEDAEIYENIMTEIYTLIEDDYQLRVVQSFGWEIPDDIARLKIGSIVKATRNIEEISKNDNRRCSSYRRRFTKDGVYESQ